MEVILIIKYFKNNLKPSMYFGFVDYQWRKNMKKGILSIYIRTSNNNKTVFESLCNMLLLRNPCPFHRGTDNYQKFFKSLRNRYEIPVLDPSQLCSWLSMFTFISIIFVAMKFHKPLNPLKYLGIKFIQVFHFRKSLHRCNCLDCVVKSVEESEVSLQE